MGNESINWDKLGFDYIKTDKRYLSHWRNGEWDAGTLTEDNVLHISEGCLLYTSPSPRDRTRSRMPSSA